VFGRGEERRRAAAAEVLLYISESDPLLGGVGQRGRNWPVNDGAGQLAFPASGLAYISLISTRCTSSPKHQS
jgi:hypothetical protein